MERKMYKAICFVNHMVEDNGQDSEQAICISANYYGIDANELRKHLAGEEQEDNILRKAARYTMRMFKDGIYYGQAVYTAADYYNIDVEILKYYLSHRGGKANTGKTNKNKGRHFQYYLIAVTEEDAQLGFDYSVELYIFRAISKESAMSKEEDRELIQNRWAEDRGSDLGYKIFYSIPIGVFDTKEEAREYAKKVMDENEESKIAKQIIAIVQKKAMEVTNNA